MANSILSASTAKNPLVTQAQQAGAKLQSKTEAALSKTMGTQSPQQITEAAKRLQKGGLKATDKAQVRNLAEAKLADTMFKTGPKDELLSVDVFGVSDTGILNNITDKLSGFALDALGSFRKSPGLVSDLTSMIRRDGDGFSFDKQALTDRVLSAMGGTSNIMRGMSDGLQTQLTQGFGIDSGLYDEVEAVVGEATYSFTSGNLKDARGIFDLVNQITGKPKLAQFFDVGAEANMLSGLFCEAIRLGVPDAVTELVSASNSSTAADYALRGNIEVAVTYSDLDTTSLMVDQLGLNRVLADVPDAVIRLVRNYRLPAGTTNDKLDAELVRLTTTLAKLDPTWATVDRGGSEVSSLAVYRVASADALKLFERDDTYRIPALIAAQYTAENMIQEARAMYPYAVL